jgi:prepilin-type processing-associated H-X9-DG protein
MYFDDSDQRTFFFAHNIEASRMRPTVAIGSKTENRWWHQMEIYTKSVEILVCAEDRLRTSYPLETLPRSYMANRATEGLSLSQIEYPSQIVLITEKIDKANDTWFDPPRDLYINTNFGEPATALLRHTGSSQNAFLDGHARSLSKGAWLSEPCGLPYSGVDLMRLYPLPNLAGTIPFWTTQCPG